MTNPSPQSAGHHETSGYQVVCPGCGRVIGSTDINVRALIARCEVCNRIFGIPASQGSAATTMAPTKPGSLVYESGPVGEISIKRSWREDFDSGPVFFGLVWIAFFVFLGCLSSTEDGSPLPSWIPWLAVLIGVGPIYLSVGRIVNSTVIAVDQNSLVVHHGPMPWGGNHKLKSTDIDQIELVYQTIMRAREVSMAIWANHSNGRRIRLLDLKNHREAEYIAWHLADALKCELLR